MSTKNKFNYGITGLKKAEMISMTMVVVIGRARQQLMKTLKQWRKLFWIIDESRLDWLLIMLAYRSVHAKQFLRTRFSHETWGGEDYSKIVKKQHHMDIIQEMLTAFNDDPDFLKKAITGEQYDIETKAQTYPFATIDKIKESSVKSEAFAYYLLRLQWGCAS